MTFNVYDKDSMNNKQPQPAPKLPIPKIKLGYARLLTHTLSLTVKEERKTESRQTQLMWPAIPLTGFIID
ncbi:hypothetical protein ACTXT7_002253 [Hymenolepis weldensis]